MENTDSIDYQGDVDMHVHFETLENNEPDKNITSNDQIRLFESSLEAKHKTNKNKSNFYLRNNDASQNLNELQVKMEKMQPISDAKNASITDILNNAPCQESLKSISDSRLKLLKEEITALVKQCAEKEDVVKSLEKRLKGSEHKFSELKKKHLMVEKKYEKLVVNSEETKKKYEAILSELTAAKSQRAEFKSMRRESFATKSELERRLNQMLSHTEKLKAELEKMNQTAKDLQEKNKKQLEDKKLENSLLSKQKTELFVVVTKQMKLITNLRRQILHLQAGILQKFTESEIKKAVDSHIEM